MIAVVPEPPLLVPQLATGAAEETADLRAAVLAAGRRLASASAEWIVVGSDAGGRRSVGADARGTFAGFGADVVVGMSPGAAGPVDPELPLPLLIASWLAEGLGVTLRGELVAPDTPARECAALGTELARATTALLVVGDGSAKHTEKAPGYFDERAHAYDAAVADALAAGDPAALAAAVADPGPAAELWVSGRAPWLVMAGAAQGAAWRVERGYSAAPFGVHYHVAVWER
ncbi:Catalytic LigB subunit of aromatic ring-opening dioxygenase [Pseudonocardia thermophila]|uniref:Catalytic LigB subunit of aromatic ring-opening dioxygenase n=1 Tax=Pseudonocardia thermophila TaxID=1848 RepID=A0A1M6QV66_PSETH|nr:hypothetical protein [Pseudonocardia thermophila]SHK24114.1 Catalytic LigB subunit of aromatic ring-opening dioxygenase [Pseudonocardia thermophila]